MDKEDIINTHTHKYYPAIKKNEILPSVTTWMNLDSFMLSEIRLRKTNSVMISLIYVDLKKTTRLIDTEDSHPWLPEVVKKQLREEGELFLLFFSSHKWKFLKKQTQFGGDWRLPFKNSNITVDKI